jgi:small subunit ribosomal protein S8
MVNDIISDFLTKMRNAINAKHHLVEVPLTNITKSIAQILKEEGFLNDFKILKKNILVLSLKYSEKNKQPIISTIQRISKPGLRNYVNNKTKTPSPLPQIDIDSIPTPNLTKFRLFLKRSYSMSQLKNMNCTVFLKKRKLKLTPIMMI